MHQKKKMKNIHQNIYKAILIPFLTFLYWGGGVLKAQSNLFQNSGFEEQWVCPSPTNTDTFLRMPHWTIPLYDRQNLYNPRYPDTNQRCDARWLDYTFYHSPIFYMRPHTGLNAQYLTPIFDWRNQYGSEYPEQRCYAQTTLKQKLIKDESYYFEMYIRRVHWEDGNWGVVATNGQGVLFSETPTRYDVLNDGSFLQSNPPNTNGIIIMNRDSVMRDTNYQKIAGCFQAKGKEQFATFGGFLTNQNINRLIIKPMPLGATEWHADYVFDDVLLIPMRVGIPKDTAICEGDTLKIDARRQFPVSRRWNDGSIDSIKTITASGTYTLFTQYNANQLGCTQTETINVKVIPKNIRTRIFDTLACDNKTITLSAGFGVPNETVTWQNNLIAATQKVNKTNHYWANVVNFCVNYTDTFRVKYENCQINVFAPNAFSPNGDQQNDFFKPYVHQSQHVVVKNYQLSIFNRWGNLIFTTTDINEAWNGENKGQAAPESVYVWLINATLEVDGEEVVRVFLGDVSLLK